MGKSIFYVAQYFTPEPYLKDIQFIKDLERRGWEPVVITGFPNYPKGEIYEGYTNKWFHEEMMDGIRVIRTYSYSDHSTNSFKRTLNYLVFGVFASLAILKFGKKSSFYYILQSSPFVVFCAWVVKLFKGKSKTLLDIQDVFPENIRVSGFIKSPTVLNILDWCLDHFYYKFFDYFVTVSESFKKMVAKKGINEQRILTLYNWSMVEQQNQVKSHDFGGDSINIVYAGNIGVHQGLSELADSIIKLQEKVPKLKFHFFGDGTDYDILNEKLKGANNSKLYGRVTPEEIGTYLHGADVLFLHLVKDPVYECIIPSKLQAYIEVGKPILAGLEGEARAFITEYKIGEVFEPENSDSFVQACINISNYSEEHILKINEISLNLYKTKFSRKAGADRLHEFISKI